MCRQTPDLLIDLNMRPCWVWLQFFFHCNMYVPRNSFCFVVSFVMPQDQRVVLQTVRGYSASFAPEL